MTTTTVVDNGVSVSAKQNAGQEIIPADRPPPPMPAQGAPQARQPLPSLARALAHARDRCKAASKSSRNRFHGYDYASADEVIATASDALEGSGLAIIPAREELVGIGTILGLNRLLLLAHESGEVAPLEIRGWPIVEEKGRPLDKAYAIALTSSLAYKLRDLLQMPRGTEDDMEAQSQAAPPQAEAPALVPTAPVAPAHAPGLDFSSPAMPSQVSRINELLRELKVTPPQRDQLLASRKVEAVEQLTVAQAGGVIAGLERKLADARPAEAAQAFPPMPPF